MRPVEADLDVEGRAPRAVTGFAQVERALRALKPYGQPTFAILDRRDGSYLQVAGGQVSATIELHRSDALDRSGTWRAFLKNPHPNYTAPVTKHFGAGTLLLQPDEVLWVDDVVAVFAQFLGGEDFPDAVGWRDMVAAD